MITAGLGDVPYAAECSLAFSDSPVWRASEFQRTIREAQPYAVLVAAYDGKWQIRVNPAPHAWRSTVRARLREQGLPLVADWLRSFKGAGCQDRYHRMELVFAPADGTLAKKLFEGV